MTDSSVRRSGRYGPWLFAASAALAGCAPGTGYHTPEFPFRNAFTGAPSSVAPVLLTNADWWRQLDDPVFDALVGRALAGNISLALAIERVTEAETGLRGIAPEASLDTELSARHEGGGGVPDRTRTEARLAFDWLFDIHGARREQQRGARARIEVADTEVDAARLLLLGNLANAYVDLRHSQRLRQLRRQELASRRQTLELTRTLYAQDAATRLDLVQAEALVSDTNAALPQLDAAIAARQHTIAALLGTAPGLLGIDLDRGIRQPRPPLSPEVGIPADLLRNRPDIRIAERRYYAAHADLGAARAEELPQLSLSGTLSLTSAQRSGQPAHVFGPVLRLPAVPGSPRRAATEARESQLRQARMIWEQTVLDAIAEVETALAEYGASHRSLRSAERSVQLYAEAVSLTRAMIEGNGGTLRDLIDAELRLATANSQRTENQRQLGRSFVALNVNLGSGSSHVRGAAAD
ncbi:MAG: efflux transporter outer membrane subunit [Gemmobacter sp.]